MRCFTNSKGQIKPKADWRAIDSPKKTNERIWVFSAMTVRKYLKPKEKHQIGSFGFWENLQNANLLLVLSELYHDSQSGFNLGLVFLKAS